LGTGRQLLVTGELEQVGRLPGWRVTRADTLASAWQLLHADRFDVVLLSVASVDESVGDWAQRARAAFPQLGILLRAADGDAATAVAVMHMALTDVIVGDVIDDDLVTRLGRLTTDRGDGESVQMTDPHLLNALRADQEAAWQTFYETYAQMIVGWAHAMGCPNGLEDDVLQEVTLQLRRHLTDFRYDRSRGSFRGFLKTAVRWRVVDAQRRRARLQPLADSPGNDGQREPAEARIPDARATADVAADLVFLRAALHAALKRARARVGERTAAIFERYRLRREPAETVAAEFDVNVQTVYEAARRFREEHLGPALVGVIAEYGESVDDAGKVLASAIEACVTEQPAFQMTMTRSQTPAFAARLREAVGWLERWPPPRAPGAQLLVLPPSGQAFWRQLVPGEAQVLGRLPGLTVSLPESSLSGCHCALSCEQGAWILADRNSKNGVWVNGEALATPRELCSGDIVQTADVRLLFHVQQD
jgi:RNA polymerase sigma factor (sigma-70 family)